MSDSEDELPLAQRPRPGAKATGSVGTQGNAAAKGNINSKEDKKEAANGAVPPATKPQAKPVDAKPSVPTKKAKVEPDTKAPAAIKKDTKPAVKTPSTAINDAPPSKKAKTSDTAKPVKREANSAPGAKKTPLVKKDVPKPTTKPSASAPQKSAAKSTNSVSETKMVKPKKEYDLPGQTKDAPDERDPLRRFYESLLEQRPKSEMANKWCIQHGLCAIEHAEKFLKSQGKVIGNGKVPRPRVPPATPLGKRPPTNGDKPSIKRPPTNGDKPPIKRPSSAPKPASKKPRASHDTAFNDVDDEESDEEVLPVSHRARKTPAVKTKPAVKVVDDSDDEDDKPLALWK